MKSLILVFTLVFSGMAYANGFDLFCVEKGTKNFVALYSSPYVGNIVYMDGEQHCQTDEDPFVFPGNFQRALIKTKIVRLADGSRDIQPRCEFQDFESFTIKLATSKEKMGFDKIIVKDQVFADCMTEEEFFTKYPDGEVILPAKPHPTAR